MIGYRISIKSLWRWIFCKNPLNIKTGNRKRDHEFERQLRRRFLAARKVTK